MGIPMIQMGITMRMMGICMGVWMGVPMGIPVKIPMGILTGISQRNPIRTASGSPWGIP